MEVKPGYKQTEVGVIPEDWVVKRIGDFEPFVTSGSRGWAAYYSERGAPFIRITNLSRESIYLDLEDLRLVNLPQDTSESIRTQLQDNDVLISITADIGIIGYVSEDVPKPAYINQHIALVRFDSSNTDSKFVSYFLASAKPQKLFRALTDSGAKAGMSLLTVHKIHLALPPTKAEQTAIAQVLSDADELITALEKLIAKKRNIKQGAMQQFLTGKKRLPGFSGKWEAKKLGEVCELENGYAFKSNTYNDNGEYLIITIANVQDGRMDILECSRISELPKDIQAHQILYYGDLLISMTGNVGRICRVNANNTLLNQRVGKLIPIDIDIDFFFYLLNDRKFLNKMIVNAQGGAQGNIGKGDILEYKAYIPKDKSEQTAIAEVLSDMDAEITALETKLEKYKMIKEGMMQELLTGKKRLI
ncbi:MAG TPA: restriction endonuclease subunit S [Sedimentisphaerales bacterium]|nr:restriction endonuclease subunit S [Sedimentisphaerales bacterium]